MSEYAVVLERATDGGWSAFAPDVPGVVASADSREEVEIRMREALEIHRDQLERAGEPQPEARTQVSSIRVS